MNRETGHKILAVLLLAAQVVTTVAVCIEAVDRAWQILRGLKKRKKGKVGFGK